MYYNALVCVGWYWLCACCIAAIYILTDILIIKINSSILIYIYVNKFILVVIYKYILHLGISVYLNEIEREKNFAS